MSGPQWVVGVDYSDKGESGQVSLLVERTPDGVTHVHEMRFDVFKAPEQMRLTRPQVVGAVVRPAQPMPLGLASPHPWLRSR